MAVKELSVKLSPIAKEIDKATKKLKAIRKKLSPKERKKLDLEIKDLCKARVLIAESCRKMTVIFPTGG
jgi:hypothetical protein